MDKAQPGNKIAHLVPVNQFLRGETNDKGFKAVQDGILDQLQLDKQHCCKTIVSDCDCAVWSGIVLLTKYYADLPNSSKLSRTGAGLNSYPS